MIDGIHPVFELIEFRLADEEPMFNIPIEYLIADLCWTRLKMQRRYGVYLCKLMLYVYLIDVIVKSQHYFNLLLNILAQLKTHQNGINIAHENVKELVMYLPSQNRDE